jgi:hypothetical protein
MIGETDKGKTLFGARRAILMEEALQAKTEFDILLHGQPGEKRGAGILKEHDALFSRSGDRLIAVEEFTGGRLFKAGKEIEKRAFAAAGGAEEAENFTVGDMEIDLVEGEVGVILAELF